MLSLWEPMEVFKYLDYRQFLKDWYAEKKIANPKYSYRVLASKVGFQSAGYFTQVLQGKTNISLRFVDGFCDTIGFRKKEREYFQTLVLYNQAKDGKRKAVQKAKLDALRAVQVKKLAPGLFRFFEKWHHNAIRELLATFHFKGDYQALGRMLRPAIAADEAEASVRLLLELGMIRKTGQGSYEKVDPVLTTGYDAAGPLVETFFLAMHKLGAEALGRFPREDRNLSWLTVSVSRRKYAEIVDELRLFRRRVLQMAESDPAPEAVYHLNCELFPLANPAWKDKP